MKNKLYFVVSFYRTKMQFGECILFKYISVVLPPGVAQLGQGAWPALGAKLDQFSTDLLYIIGRTLAPLENPHVRLSLQLP